MTSTIRARGSQAVSALWAKSQTSLTVSGWPVHATMIKDKTSWHVTGQSFQASFNIQQCPASHNNFAK